MRRYGALTARSYDLLSGEPVYGTGRRLAVAALDLRPGQRVLDVGCGTGLNLPALAEAVGPAGSVLGLDRSAAMLAVARRRRAGLPAPVSLVEGDVTDARCVAAAAGEAGVDAVLATYALSLVPDVEAAWAALRAVLRPRARVAVVDMARPTGRWAWSVPITLLACRLGGADVDAHPWRVVERDLRGVRSWTRWGGHVQVRVGTL